MDNDRTTSISEGCFIFRKRKTKTSKLYIEGRYGKKRYKQYLECINKVEKITKELEREVFSCVLQDLSSYVAGFTPDSSTYKWGEVPAAALLTGVNMPDHDVLFSTLQELLCSAGVKHVVRLHSKQCQNIKLMVQRAVLGLIGTGTEDESVKEQRCNFPALKTWYNRQKARASPHSPRKRKRTSQYSGPLVIILEDTEAFNSTVLQDFILICSEEVSTIPVVLVLGFALGATALQTLLSQGVSSKLSLQRFHSQPASAYLSEVIKKLIIESTLPVKLGGKTLRLLLDQFLNQDFAVSSFISAYKLCILEHYSSEQWAVLCCFEECISARVSDLTQDDLQLLREFESFKKYLVTLSPKKKKNYEDDEYMKSELESLLFAVHNHHKLFVKVCEFVFELFRDLPTHPLGHQIREVYCRALLGPFTEYDEYKEAVKLFGFLGRDDFAHRLDNVLILLGDMCKTTKYKELRFLGEGLIFRSENLKRFTKLKAPQKSDQFELKFDKKMDRFQLKDKLLEAAKAKTQQENPYVSTRDELLTWLTDTLKSLLQPPTTLPFHELVYFNSHTFLKHHFIPVPRSTIHKRLADPGLALQCECCEITSASTVLPSMPDLCIAFKVHLEYGRLVNVYDWMQAFIAVVSKEGEKIDGRKPKPQYQARFIQAVAELEFLGFVKQTGRKTDHVMRLTWGSAT